MSPTENDTGPKVKNRAKHDDDSVSSEREGGNEEDRLSDLPDCVLIHLLTFMRTDDSVRTCVLSRRWKDLWKRVPSLILLDDACGFRLRMTPFSKFVPEVLSLRDSSVPLHTLHLRYNGLIPAELLTRVVTYAVSHNIQSLKIHVTCNDTYLPPIIFSCQTLRSLDLAVDARFLIPTSVPWQPSVPKSLNLRALTTLRVKKLAFCEDENKVVEPFSSCVSLKTLVIDRCVIRNQQILCISNATLVNLSISIFDEKEAYEIVLSTPNLCSFTFKGVISQQLTASDLSCLKEVNIDVYDLESSRLLQSGFSS